MVPLFSQRVKKLRNLMKGFDRLLITDPNNIYYYTGHMASADDPCFLVLSDSRPHLFVSPLVNEAKLLKNVNVSFLKKDNLIESLKGVVGFEDCLTTGFYLKLKQKGIKLKPSGDITYEPREIKDEYEIEKIEKSILAVKKAMKEVKQGLTEDEIASRIELNFMKQGATKSFSPIVATGSNGQFIHYTPGIKKVRADELTIVDVGARVDGYCSDITRTAYGKLSPEKQKIYDAIHEMQGKIIDILEPGLSLDDIQAAYKSMMDERRYATQHMVSHGIGLSVHESIDTLKPGMVITIEPGVYTKSGGCRIEDMILIKKNGVRILSNSISLRV